MPKRMFMATGAMAAIGGTIFVTLVMIPPRPGLTKANFDRITKDMTLTDVEALFGSSPDQSIHNFGGVGSVHFWICPSGNSVQVHIADGEVIHKHWPKDDETVIDKLRQWARPQE